MAKNMMAKYKKYWGDQDIQKFLLYVVVVLDPRFKLKYVRFCFGRLYDVEDAENFTIKVKDTLLRLFEHYMNVDENVEVVHSVGTSINENVDVDLMVVNDDMLFHLCDRPAFKMNTYHKLKVSYIIRYVIIKHALVKELLILQVQNDHIKP
jgi:hypothetical protein